MLRFLSFGSGSSGNCYYLESDGGSIIIDAGVGIRTIKKYLKVYGINQSRILSILVTHDHTDHVAAVSSLSIYLHIPVYATPVVHARINTNYRIHNKIPKQFVRFMEKESPFTIGNFEITAFDVPHDSADCSGYSIAVGDKKFVIVTDCGNITNKIIEYIHEADFLVLEANYDTEMLKNGSYPYYLKKRILSSVGHLSNDVVSELLKSENLERLKHLFLCHLSENNNTPEIVSEVVGNALKQYRNKVEFDVLARRKPTGFFDFD